MDGGTLNNTSTVVPLLPGLLPPAVVAVCLILLKLNLFYLLQHS